MCAEFYLLGKDDAIALNLKGKDRRCLVKLFYFF